MKSQLSVRWNHPWRSFSRWLDGRMSAARRRGRLHLEALEDRLAPAISVGLVKVINTLSDSNPSQGVNLNGTSIFAASDGVNGRELWKSDGTAAGTVLLKDLNPGQTAGTPNSSNPSDFTLVGNIVYFTADNGTNGVELWKTDGTDAGTALVKDIRPGAPNGSVRELTAVGTLLIFSANDGVGGQEIWKSDGTTGGTVQVGNINAGAADANPTSLTALGTNVFFAADDGATGVEFWMTNGTTNTQVKNINPAGSSTPQDITVVGNTLFFSATEAANGRELYKSDGTGAGTVLVKNINPAAADSNPTNLTAVGTTLFFRADDGTNGIELWKSDGTAAGTVLVKDINPGAASSTPANLTPIGTTLFFSATDPSGTELWKSDGTTAGTVQVKDIVVGVGSSNPGDLTAIGTTLFFSADDGTNSFELWRTDGSNAGTVQLKDINPGALASNPGDFTVVGTNLLFAANNGVNGNELWKSDGTTAGTVLVKDINTSNGTAFPFNFANVNGTVFFSATDGTTGFELWKTDGTANGTVLVKDIFPGAAGGAPNNSFPGNLVAFGGKVFFSASDATNGNELWQSDGTAAGTTLVKDIVAGTGNSFPANLTVVGSTLYFTATDANGTELWKTDGTAAGTVLVKDINPGAGSSFPDNLLAVGNTLFFTATNATNGTELWKSDGTNAGTVLLEIVPGAGSSSPAELQAIGTTVYFSATGPANGRELWKSDGTAATTVEVRDIVVGAGNSNPENLTVVGTTLYFTATDATGSELWKSDGTAVGTVQVKDIVGGAVGSNPQNLTAVGTTLFFSATDATNGSELWKSDGTAAGTVLVKDIFPGATGSNPATLVNLNGTLFFSATDSAANGNELWQSDGTTAGTIMAKDINPGPGNGAPFLTKEGVAGTTLFFRANDSLSSVQLWAVRNAPQISSITTTTANGTYGVGTQIPITVTFDTPVTLAGGNLTINLTGGGTVTITPFTNQTTATGTYTVAAGQTATPLDTNSPLVLAAGATLRDAGGANVDLTIPTGKSLRDTKTINIDTGAVAAVGIASITSTTASGTYGVGAQINVTVTFTKPLTLAGGNLTINLNSGGSITIAPFTNQTTVQGTYTVAAGQTANPLDTNSPIVLAAGATLRDANGVNAALTIPAGKSLRNDKTIVIGTQPFNFDKLGAYRASNGSWSLDSDGKFGFDINTDQVFLRFSPPNTTGVAGDWDGDGRDSIGDFSNGTWHLDLNDNGVLDPGETFTFGQAGDKPVVGDWNGDGKSKLGVFRNSPDGFSSTFILDTNNNRMMDAGDENFVFGAANDRVVIGDWTGDKKSKVGVFRDAASVGTPGAAIFTLDTNGNKQFDGGDQIFIFGTFTDGLVVGDWNGNGISKVGVYRPGTALNAPGTALFSLDTNGNRGFDQGVDDVFLYGLTTDQFLGGNWKVTPPLVAQLRAAGGARAGQGEVLVMDASFQMSVDEAISLWAQAGLNPADVARLQALDYAIMNLGGAALGQSDNGRITLDDDAAGYGWSATGEADKMDLVTALAHEMGHALGIEHSEREGDLMFDALADGVRKTPPVQNVDAVFAAMDSCDK